MVQKIYWNNAERDVSPDYPTGDFAYYVAGLADGEGTFYRDSGTKKFRFRIKMKDEHELLERVRDFFGCGHIYTRTDPRTDSEMVIYAVADARDMARTIIPFFNEYEMIGTSGEQFDRIEKEFWKAWGV